MIGKLKGIVEHLGEDYVLLDVHGVGYIVHCSGRTLQSLPSLGEAAALLIETIVREDMIRLFGFAHAAEQQWFNILLNVQGVGQKVALALLSTLTPDALAHAIMMKDKAMIARTPGIGPKLAERICVELKDKVPAGWEMGGASSDFLTPKEVPSTLPAAVRDALSALQNLGYAPAQAQAAIAAAQQLLGQEAEARQLIRQGLRELAR